VGRTEIAYSVWRLFYGLADQGSGSMLRHTMYLFSRSPYWLRRPQSLLFHWCRWLCLRRYSGPGREADYSPLFNPTVKKKWRYTSAFPICLHCVCRDQSISFIQKGGHTENRRINRNTWVFRSRHIILSVVHTLAFHSRVFLGGGGGKAEKSTLSRCQGSVLARAFTF
jgi:hypothetical protein